MLHLAGGVVDEGNPILDVVVLPKTDEAETDFMRRGNLLLELANQVDDVGIHVLGQPSVQHHMTLMRNVVQHRSQRRSIEEADLIFTFDEQNRERVIDRFPSAANRVFGLGILCSRRPYIVADPYGGSVSQFQDAYTQISDAIDSLSDTLSADATTRVDQKLELEDSRR